MTKKKRIIIICVSIALAVIILAGAVLGGAVLSAKLISVVINSHSNIFFLMPRSYIKNKLTEEFPLGSSAEDVAEKLQEHEEHKVLGEWKIYGKKSEAYLCSGGIRYRSNGEVMSADNYEEPGDRVVGTQHIHVNIGSLLNTYARVVFFVFDENGILIDIAVKLTA